MAKQRKLKDDRHIAKTKHYLKPTHLTRYLKQSLDNGRYRLTWEEIGGDLFGRNPTEQDVAEIRHCWHQSEKQLRRLGTCCILVTDVYFESFEDTEPNQPHTIAACIAGYRGGKSAGIRLLTMKGTRNDPMALAYLSLRSRAARGMVAALEDRATIEWTRGKMSKRVAKRMIDNVSAPVLPDHDKEFGELME